MHIYIEFTVLVFQNVLKQFENIQYTLMYHCLHKCARFTKSVIQVIFTLIFCFLHTSHHISSQACSSLTLLSPSLASILTLSILPL